MPEGDHGQTSDDGQGLTTVSTVADAAKGLSTTSFASVRARFLRLRITATWDTLRRNAQVAELVVTP